MSAFEALSVPLRTVDAEEATRRGLILCAEAIGMIRALSR